MVRGMAVRWVWLCLALLATPLWAQEIELYEGEVQVGNQGEAARTAALPVALGHVLMRLTGDSGVTADAALTAELSRAPGLVEQYRYREDVDTSTGSAVSRTLLIVRFQRAAVDELVARGGRSVWPTPRPAPVVWLAIDDGRGPRMLGSAQSTVVAALTRRAEYRGLRVAYPLLDLEEQQRIVVSAFWAGDSAAARRGSGRYQSRVALVGKLFRNGGGWTAQWKLYDGEQLLAEVSPSAADAPSVLAAGADLAADTLAARAASVASSSGPAGLYQVAIEGIASGEDYARVMAYLGQLSVVRSASPRHAEGDRLELELDLATGLEGLARLIESGTTLSLVSAGASSPRYRLQP